MCIRDSDYPTATLMDQAGIDVILVGDSVGMVVHGFENTLPVTMDMMVMHCQAVRRGARRALLVADMPFMSYQASVSDALRNAARLLAEGGADAVKLEGGQSVAATVRALVETGIAVMGHIGLTPQSVSALGGFKVQGGSIEDAHRLLPGEGVIPLEAILRELKATGFDGLCSIELFRPAYWERPAPELARSAREATLKLLRPLFDVV